MATINPATGKPYSTKPEDMLKSGINPLTGKPLTTEQKKAQHMQTLSSSDALKASEATTATALKKSPTLDNFTHQGSENVQAQRQINQKYNLDPLAGLKGEATDMQPGQTMPRDFERELATAKKLGMSNLANITPEQEKQLFQATYKGDELSKLGLSQKWEQEEQAAAEQSASNTTTVALADGTALVYNPAALADLGLTPERLQELIDRDELTPEMIAQLEKSGQAANAAQGTLNNAPTPKNSNMYVLQEALKMISGTGGKGQTMTQSGLYDKLGIGGPALSFGALDSAIQQRRGEMSQRYDNYAQMVQVAGSQIMDTYNAALSGYKATMDDYNKQLDRVMKIDESVRDHERALELVAVKEQLDRDTFEWQEQVKAKFASNEMQFVPETENQGAGYFNKATGEFTPLSVGGSSYENVSYNDYLGQANYSDGSALYYETPVAHGSANTKVVASNPKLIDVYKNGTQKAAGASGLGGQCAAEVQKWCNLPKVGNSIKEKAQSFQKFVNQDFAFYKGQEAPQVGYSVFSNDDPDYGHYWTINAITEDGKLVASEFNRSGTRTYSNNRIVDPNDPSIIGFVKTKLNPEFDLEQIVKKATGGVMSGLNAFPGMNTLGKLAQNVGKEITGRVQQSQQYSQLSGAEQVIDEKIGKGELDDTGREFTLDRQLVRSGASTAAQINDIQKKLEKNVKNGAPQAKEALEQFKKDLLYAAEQAKNEKANNLQSKLEALGLGF